MQILTLNDQHYPTLLRETYYPPKKLYVLGNLEILQQPQIAIVGSRHATPIGLEHAHRFAYELSKAGLIVTSGLALGIDGAAHQGAVDANCPTIAVLANGLDFIYPRRHQRLADAIIRCGGAILSEWPPGTNPHAAYFPQRNRIISGMSLGTLIVEATLKSGSLITARLAMEQNREVFAIPGSIHSAQSAGCHWLINQGAKLVAKTEDIIFELDRFLKKDEPRGKSERANEAYTPVNEDCERAFNKADRPSQESGLDSAHRHLIECVDFSPTPFETIQRRSGLKSNEVSAILLSLEIKGYINKGMSGYLRLKSMT